MDKAAIDSLVLPLQDGSIEIPARAAFLRARPHDFLREIADLACEQSFKPWADELGARGFPSIPKIEGSYPMILLLPTRSRDETLWNFARAMQMLQDGGTLLCSIPNALGAARFEKELARLAGSVNSLSKHKCRAFWAVKGDKLDQGLLHQWLSLGELRKVEGGYVSRPGLFGWDKIDEGSRLLAETLPEDLKGRGADLGAGWGYLADQLLRKCPNVAELDLYEAEALALEAAEINLADRKANLRFLWQDVAKGIGGPYDFIISNPPFHEGRADQPELGQAFITAAGGALKRRGRFFLVANKHLPYEATLAKHFPKVERLAETKSFKILLGAKG